MPRARRPWIQLPACPEVERHTLCPADYVGWHVWAERMERTHEQQQCPACGLWLIWVRQRLTNETQ